MQKTIYSLLAIGLAFSLGCGVEFTQEEGKRRSAAPVGGVTFDTVESAGAPVASQPATDAAPAQSTADTANTTPASDAAPSSETTPAQPGVVQEKAEVGDGKKGRYEGSGVVVTPLKAYFRTQQRIVYEVQIPHAMKLYQATNGSYPKSQEEFMSQIIEPNQIKLPELPPGHRYVYDPQKAELMVEKPAQ